MNITLTAPNGSSHHGNPGLICVPPKWYDILVFFLVNYAAHAFSIIGQPGQSRRNAFTLIIAALLFPTSGTARAVHAIKNSAVNWDDKIRRAAGARALVMIIPKPKKEDSPSERTNFGGFTPSSPHDLEAGPTDSVSHDTFETQFLKTRTDGGPDDSTKGKIDPSSRKKVVEETWYCPEGNIYVRDILEPEFHVFACQSFLESDEFTSSPYEVAYLPANAPIQEPPCAEKSSNNKIQELSGTYNFPQLIISLAQAIWAGVTLYQARGDQIDRYGYAAFGLTVAPYLWMTILNIIGNFATPQYPALFLVRTPTMDTAEEHLRFKFPYTIDVKELDVTENELHKEKQHNLSPLSFPFLNDYFLPLLIGYIPLAINGGISRFQANGSTSLQRGFTMAWLVWGVYQEAGLWLLSQMIFLRLEREISLILCAAPNIGGMVVTGMMFKEYGSCTLF